MANNKFDKGREGFLAGDIGWGINGIKAILVDLHDCGGAAGGWIVTGVTNATNPQITTSAAHGLAVGDRITITGVAGATGANGTWDVLATPTTTTFTITAAAPGAYTSGGYLANLSKQFLSEFVPLSGRVATSPRLTSKTLAKGVADAADVTWASAPGPDQVEAVILVRSSTADNDAGDLAATAQRLIAYYDTIAGLPVTPNGGDIVWQIDNGANRLFRI